MAKIRIAVLCSGGGTNLQAIIDASGRGDLPSGQIELVISDNPSAYALERASANGIKSAVVSKKDIPREQRERIMLGLLEENGIQLVVLAGFMSVLSANFISRFEGRIVNIHPSLIPSFCGVGMYGLHVHEAALARGVKITGATVHFVNEECDGGPIIAQKAVEVLDGDTPESLQLRVMRNAEWVIYPLAIEKVCKSLLSKNNV